MHFRLLKNYLLFLFFIGTLDGVFAQCLPDTEETFFAKLTNNGQLPPRLLSGRTLFFHAHTFSDKELKQIQQSFAETGIDAISVIPLEVLLAGEDVRQAVYRNFQKREISNLIFIQKNAQGYRCVVTTFNGEVNFVDVGQSSWQAENYSLGEVLLQLKREAMAGMKVQNLLINEQPETDVTIKVILGSRIEGFTPDLRIDRVALRLSSNENENMRIKEISSAYPFKIEFVADSLSDAQLRGMGFWYVLNCLHAREQKIRHWLEYAPPKTNALLSSGEKHFQPNEVVYKFYFKKLEYDNVYLGKQWDAASTWGAALQNFITSLRNELAIR